MMAQLPDFREVFRAFVVREQSDHVRVDHLRPVSATSTPLRGDKSRFAVELIVDELSTGRRMRVALEYDSVTRSVVGAPMISGEVQPASYRQQPLDAARHEETRALHAKIRASLGHRAS